VSLEPKHLLAPLIAIAVLAVVGLETSSALRQSGAWAIRRKPTKVAAPDPYARLEAQIALLAVASSPSNLRDPFTYGRAPVSVDRTPPKPKLPPPPPQPVLTAILQSGSDPRALLRYSNRDYTVKIGDLFADFKVVSITAEQVVLDRGGSRLVLFRPTKGE
jgi:hypothetical protein